MIGFQFNINLNAQKSSGSYSSEFHFDQNMISTEDLNKTEQILSSRFDHFGLTQYELRSDGKGTFMINVKDHPGDDYINDLILARGELRFYETYDNQEFQKLASLEFISKMKKVEGFFTGGQHDAVIGSADEEQLEKINSILDREQESGSMSKDIRFVWSKYLDQNDSLRRGG